MENNHLISYLLLAPLAGGLLLLFINKSKENFIKYFGFGFSIITFIISLFIYAEYDINKGGFQIIDNFNWIPNLHISYHVGMTVFLFCLYY